MRGVSRSKGERLRRKLLIILGAVALVLLAVAWVWKYEPPDIKRYKEANWNTLQRTDAIVTIDAARHKGQLIVVADVTKRIGAPDLVLSSGNDLRYGYYVSRAGHNDWICVLLFNGQRLYLVEYNPTATFQLRGWSVAGPSPTTASSTAR
jgi:hypothetical protein